MHGVTFGTKHSYNDWGLLLKSRPTISPPEPKTIYVDIPGADGSIDLTESLTGEVSYKNRTISCEFVVMKDRIYWSEIYSNILDYLHGKKMKIILDEDPAYYYIGRLNVNEWKSDKKTSSIVVEGNVEPYKYEITSSTEDWIWDSFNFESGIILPKLNEITITDSWDLNFQNTRKSIIPTFTVISTNGEGMTASVSNNKGIVNLTLPDGVTKNPTFILCEGSNTISIRGNGTVTVDFRRARL